MIKTITLTNFQSHRNTRLELEPGVNVIVGPSDSGKSAILRAVNWAVFNRPLGDSMRSSWGGDTEVEITTDDAAVTRRRTDTQAVYVVDGRVLKATGTEPPEQVSAALRVDNLNIQRQHDQPFMLSESSGERARLLNKIVSLDVIDSALHNINGKVREYQQQAAGAETELASARTEAESLSWIASAERDASALVKLESALNKNQATLFRLQRAAESMQRVEDELARLPDITGADEELAQIDRAMAKLKTGRGVLEKLINAVSVFARVEQELQEREQQLAGYTKKFQSAMAGICPLCGRF